MAGNQAETEIVRSASETCTAVIYAFFSPPHSSEKSAQPGKAVRKGVWSMVQLRRE